MRSITASLRPGIRELTKDHKPGDILARLDLDPYSRSFRNVSTHILATGLSEPALRDALRDGHAYVSHDWMCDPTGFRFELVAESESPDVSSRKTERRGVMGDQLKFAPGLRLLAEFPASCRIRLINNGKLAAERSADRMEYEVQGPGVYRVEGWLEPGGEERGWIYSNPIYVRQVNR